MIGTFQPQKMSLSLDKRYEIVFLHEHPAGPKWGYDKIAAHVRCNKSIAIYWVKKYKQNKDLTDEPKSGRSHCTTKAQDKRIVKMATKNTTLPVLKFKGNLKRKV